MDFYHLGRGPASHTLQTPSPDEQLTSTLPLWCGRFVKFGVALDDTEQIIARLESEVME